jgi:hypothetical protein
MDARIAGILDGGSYYVAVFHNSWNCSTVAVANEIQTTVDDGSEIQPGDIPKHYFSCPTDDDDIALLGTQKAAVLAGPVRLYLFITLKSRNDYLPSGEVEVTEFCGYFVYSFQGWHNCDNNRSYLQSVPVN